MHSDYVFITSIITDISSVYIWYKIMKLFFEISKTSKFVEIISIVVWCVLCNIIQKYVKIPSLMVILNLIAFFLISLNYQATFRQRTTAAVMGISILFIAEMLVFTGIGISNFNWLGQSKIKASLFALISITLISYFFIRILGNLKNLKNRVAIPLTQWICIFIIPASTFFILMILTQNTSLKNYQYIICVIFLLFLNFIIFLLYDYFRMFFGEKEKMNFIKNQNAYYKRQLRQVTESEKKLKFVKHDLKNHFNVVMAWLKLGRDDRAVEYIKKATVEIDMIDFNIITNNFEIDSLLNNKINQAKLKDIGVTLDVKIPMKIGIEDLDLVVIIGNLFDNAIEAVIKSPNEKRIKFAMGYTKSMITIKMENTFDGIVKKSNGIIVTRKQNNATNGIGLKSINNSINKYNGDAKITYTSNIFAISIILYEK